MKRIFLPKGVAFISIFCVFLGCGTGSARPNVRWIHQYPYQTNGTAFLSFVAERTVRIETVSFMNGNRTTTGVGAGAIISGDGLVLTANHVLGAQFLKIYVYRCSLVPNFGMITCGAPKEATLIRRDTRNDTALIRVSGVSGWPRFRLGKTQELQNGDLLWRAGMDVTGWAAGVLLEPHLQSRSIEVLMPARGGASGGPLVDSAGQLVGIVTSTPGAEVAVEVVTYAVPIERIRSRLLNRRGQN